MKVEFVGVLFDRCGKHPGSALGPEAIRFAFERHERRDVRLLYQSYVARWRYVRSEPQFESCIGLPSFNQAIQCFRDVQREVSAVMEAGNLPIVLGGDHSVALGSVPVAQKRVAASGGRLAVLWIDAHADLNNPETSPSLNLHGMPVGALLACDSDRDTDFEDTHRAKRTEQWSQLLREIVDGGHIDQSQMAWLGLRDVDLPEARFIARKMPDSLPLTMEHVDRHGLLSGMDRFHDWFKKGGFTHLWVSFDVDALDPVLAPGTGTAVRGGLTYREGHLLAEILHERYLDQIVGLDVVEVNPNLDTDNTTVRVVVEWLSSLFGKRILPWGPIHV